MSRKNKSFDVLNALILTTDCNRFESWLGKGLTRVTSSQFSLIPQSERHDGILKYTWAVPTLLAEERR